VDSLSLPEGEAVVLDLVAGRLFFVRTKPHNWSETSGVQIPFQIGDSGIEYLELPPLKDRRFVKWVQLYADHILLLSTKQIASTKKDSKSSNGSDANVFADGGSASEPLRLEGIYDLRTNRIETLPQIIKELEIGNLLINSTGQILCELYSSDIALPKIVVLKPTWKREQEGFFGSVPVTHLSNQADAFKKTASETFLTQLTQMENGIAFESTADSTPRLDGSQTKDYGLLLLSGLLRSLEDLDPVPANEVWLKYRNYLKLYLEDLSPIEKDEFLEKLAVAMTRSIRRDSHFLPIPESKLANTILAAIKPWFGIKSKIRTDFFLESWNTTTRATPYILASESFRVSSNQFVQGNFKFFGMQISELYPIATPSVTMNHRYQIQTETNEFTLNINVRSEPRKSQHQKEQTSLPYQALRKDGRLTGLFVISPNLYSDESLVRKILSYYQGEGFYFGMPSLQWADNTTGMKDFIANAYFFPREIQNVEDGKAWLSEKIGSGEIDYLVKESHSAGSDVFLEVDKANRLLIGRKLGLTGFSEVVYILYPNVASTSIEHVTPKELNSWLLQRQRNQGSEFVFINSSCWSTSKAVLELSYDNTGLLLEIPTNELTPTFNNKVDDPERNLIESIRQGKNYQEMRAAMNHLKSAPFLLPNEPNYDRDVWQRLEGGALQYEFNITVK
jgi:hypothetical protein